MIKIFLIILIASLTLAKENGKSVEEKLPLYSDSVPSDTLLVDTSISGVSLKSKNIDLYTALALVTEASGFKLRVDTVINGDVSADIINETLPNALNDLLEPNGYSWKIENNTVVISGTSYNKPSEPVLFTITGTGDHRIIKINYPRLSRKGMGSSKAQVSTNASGEAGSINLTTEDEISFWEELTEEIKGMITPSSSKLIINKTAGVIYIKDSPDILDAVEQYVRNVIPAMIREVEITARIYEVTLNDNFALGLDWNKVSASIPTGGGNSVTITGGTSVSKTDPSIPSETGKIQITTAGGDIDVIVKAMSEQGNVQTVSQPRVITLNNQPALIKVGIDLPYFSVTRERNDQTGHTETTEEVTTVTSGVVLSVTPQISQDKWITMGIDPIITDLISTVTSSFGSTAPVIAVKQSSSIVRIKDNETVRISGLIQTKKVEEERGVPGLSKIPILGYLFKWTHKENQRRELVIFITPRIVK